MAGKSGAGAGELGESVAGPDAEVLTGRLAQEQCGSDDDARFRVTEEANGNGDVIGVGGAAQGLQAEDAGGGIGVRQLSEGQGS